MPAPPLLVPSDRLGPLATPEFVTALALLVLNDVALKPLFHNALTGKLSDFAGLFALTLFVATLWPRRSRLAAWAIAAAFMFWKTSYAGPLVEWLNLISPFAVGRTVDLTDLAALPMIPLALRAAPRLRPWPVPRMLRLGLAVFAPIAFTATSRLPYVARSAMDTSAAAVVDEARLQELFDEIAEQRGLQCDAKCQPITQSRRYVHPLGGAGVDALTVLLDEDRDTLAFTAIGYERVGRRGMRALAADIRKRIAERFPEIAVIDLTAGESYGQLPDSTIFVIRVRTSGQTPEQAKRNVSAVVQDLARVHDLRADERAGSYYSDDGVGSRRRERDLRVVPVLEDSASLMVRVERRSSGFEELQRALIDDLAIRLDAAFGSDNVAPYVPADPGRPDTL